MRHITLNTGHVRTSPRSEVAPDVIDHMRGVIMQALDASARRGHVDLPGQAGCSLSAASEGDALVVTVWRDTATHDRVPLATIGVSARGESDTLWDVLHTRYHGPPLATAAQTQPESPWCASRLDVGLGLHPEAASWLGDCARCIAWAWIEWRESLT